MTEMNRTWESDSLQTFTDLSDWVTVSQFIHGAYKQKVASAPQSRQTEMPLKVACSRQ